MLIYFFTITYGIYLSTLIEFLGFTEIFLINSYEFGEFDFYLGRVPGEIFDIYVYYEFTARIFNGLGLRKY